MALPSRPESTSDIAFFRNTGLALILATLVAGAITISLTLTQNAPMQLAAASVAMPLQEVSHE
jgi:hypothetical protein